MYNLPVNLFDLGEFGLIELITELLTKSRTGNEIIVDVGDDAAAWRGEEKPQLGTSDILVQDVHFSLDIITWNELGWKALAVNISDIAAMGGVPKYAIVSLGLPPETEVQSVTDLYHGMTEIAQEFDLVVAGGDIVAAPLVIISPSVVGTVPNGILTRSAALPGESIAVTGYLGSSAAGLKMLKAGLKFDQETISYLRQAHLRPRPRVDEGKILAQHGVRAAMDLSDGLIADLNKVCQASKVGARVWTNKVPIHPLVQAAFPADAIGLALSGGEDYELLFTASAQTIEQLSMLMSNPVTIIGEVIEAETTEVLLLDDKGKEVVWQRGGWEHFRDGS